MEEKFQDMMVRMTHINCMKNNQHFLLIGGRKCFVPKFLSHKCLLFGVELVLKKFLAIICRIFMMNIFVFALSNFNRKSICVARIPPNDLDKKTFSMSHIMIVRCLVVAHSLYH